MKQRILLSKLQKLVIFTYEPFIGDALTSSAGATIVSPCETSGLAAIAMRPWSRTCAPPLGGHRRCPETDSRTCLACARAVASQRTRPILFEIGLDGVV